MNIGVLFSGQGAQTVGMGKSLFDGFDTAKRLYEQADKILGWKLTEASFDGPDTLLTETRVCQPALYVHGFAVYQVISEKGLIQNPVAAAGLSLGELTALASAEVFDFETGLRLVAERGELMQKACDATQGSMASLIGGSYELAKQVCDDCDVDMANLNCPGQIVVSGEAEKIKKVVETAKPLGFKLVKELNVAGAYHSRLMQSAADSYESFLKDFEFSKPKFPVYSNTTAQTVSEPEEIKTALVKQVVSSVRFEECMRNAQSEQSVDHFVECGVGKVIGGLIKRTDRSWASTSVQEAEEIPESL